MRLQPGTFLQGDKYRIIDVLGQGGFGITYLAEQVMAERKVCIKEFFPKEYYNRDEDSRSISLGSQGSAEIMDLYKAKFVKEAKTIAKLDHPNIIHIFDVFTENNTAYYVMEYIEGESLSDVVKRNGSALSESVAVDYIKQAASALGYIHERKIMHLDVKPANIMLRKEEGRPILIDFGLSKQYDAEGNQTSSTPVGISHGFAPMEQYKMGGVKEFSPETDIYSLGATLYYLVVGAVPPQAAAIVDDGLPELPAHLSTNVRNAIERSMEIQRKKRPHSMDEFVALLDDSKKVVPIIPAPQSESTVIAAASANIPDESTKFAEAPKAEPKRAEAPKKEWTPKYSTEKPKKSDDNKKKSRWWMWLLGLLLIGGGAYLILGANSGDNDGKTNSAKAEVAATGASSPARQRYGYGDDFGSSPVGDIASVHILKEYLNDSGLTSSIRDVTYNFNEKGDVASYYGYRTYEDERERVDYNSYYVYEYDSEDRVLSAKLYKRATNKLIESESYMYDFLGNVTSRTRFYGYDGREDTYTEDTQYTYDSNNRVHTATQYGHKIVYTYDSNGNKTREDKYYNSELLGYYLYYYDDNNNKVRIEYYSYNPYYDHNNTLTEYTDYEYDNKNRLVKETSKLLNYEKRTWYTQTDLERQYNENDQLEKVIYGGTSVYEFEYNSQGNISNCTKTTDGEVYEKFKFEYTYR